MKKIEIEIYSVDEKPPPENELVICGWIEDGIVWETAKIPDRASDLWYNADRKNVGKPDFWFKRLDINGVK